MHVGTSHVLTNSGISVDKGLIPQRWQVVVTYSKVAMHAILTSTSSLVIITAGPSGVAIQTWCVRAGQMTLTLNWQVSGRILKKGVTSGPNVKAIPTFDDHILLIRLPFPFYCPHLLEKAIMLKFNSAHTIWRIIIMTT